MGIMKYACLVSLAIAWFCLLMKFEMTQYQIYSPIYISIGYLILKDA